LSRRSGLRRRSPWPGTTFVIAALVVAADQISKTIAEDHVSTFPHHVLGPLGLQLTYNTGASFSLFRSATGPLILLDVALVVVLAVVGYQATSRSIQVGIGLMLGGALGNLADRVTRHHGGAVVDFVTLPHFATFNLADASITAGTAIVLISVLANLIRSHYRSAS